MADKLFKDFLAESAKEYTYKIKLAVDDVDDKMLDTIEGCLEKYQLISASKFNRTPVQESPLDFPNVKYSSVYISEIVMSYPASRDFLETFLASKVGISEQCIVVYSENDPREIETALFLERSAEDWKDNYVAALGSEDEIIEGDAAGTEDQRMSLLKELEAARGERKITYSENPLSNPTLATDDVLPSDYHSFVDNVATDDVGLFGRIKLGEKGAKT